MKAKRTLPPFKGTTESLGTLEDTKRSFKALNPKNIPYELKGYAHWVVHRDKQPYNSKTGKRASTTDSRTWTAFPEVLKALESGGYDGIGFVFSSGDPYVGVDLDGCVNPETGEIETWAQQIIEDLDSYTELSPSGCGVHIIAKGRIPHGGKRGPIEMYDRDRFFTMTGHVLGGGT